MCQLNPVSPTLELSGLKYEDGSQRFACILTQSLPPHITFPVLTACGHTGWFFWVATVGIATGLREGWSGIWIVVWVRDLSHLQNNQTGSGAHPASYLCTVNTPSGDKATGVLKLSSYFHLVPTVWTGKTLCFTFTLHINLGPQNLLARACERLKMKYW